MQAREMNEAMKSLRQMLCNALGSGLSGASHLTWEITPSDEPSDRPDGSDAVSFRCRFEGALEGAAYLVVSNSALWKFNLRDVDENSGDVNAARGAAFLRALQGCASGFGESLTEFGTVTIRFEGADRSELRGELVSALWAQSDPNDPNSRHSFHLFLDSDLAGSLQSASAKPFAFPQAAGKADAANLDLVMDVELNVTLRLDNGNLPCVMCWS